MWFCKALCLANCHASDRQPRHLSDDHMGPGPAFGEECCFTKVWLVLCCGDDGLGCLGGSCYLGIRSNLPFEHYNVHLFILAKLHGCVAEDDKLNRAQTKKSSPDPEAFLMANLRV